MERISALRYGSPGIALHLRILRKWTPHFKKSETWFLAVDKHGDSIQIVGEKAGQGYAEAKLLVSRCYEIKDYTCSETDIHQRFLQNSIHMNIGPASIITELDDTDALPKSWFKFSTHDHLQTIADKNIEFPDFIGVFKKINDYKKTNEEPYVVLTLTDENGHYVPVTLWKECIDITEKFDRIKLDNQPSRIAIAVTNAKVTKYKGTVKLQATSATHVYINPDTPTTISLLHRSTIDSPSTPATTQVSTTLEELHNRKYPELIGNTFISRAQIHDYTFKDSWYQALCPTCSGQIFLKGDSWFCTTDGKPQSTNFQYNLSATIIDATSTISILLPDDTITNLIAVPCKNLIQEHNFQDRKSIPQIIENCKKNRIHLPPPINNMVYSR